jgi:hypothetical protein
MTDEEAATLESLMGGKLRELGYPVTDPAPVTRAVRRR